MENSILALYLIDFFIIYKFLIYLAGYFKSTHETYSMVHEHSEPSITCLFPYQTNMNYIKLH